MHTLFLKHIIYVYYTMETYLLISQITDVITIDHQSLKNII